MLFVVSAKTPTALREYIAAYIEFCTHADPSDFSAICYTSCVGREHYRHRFACVVQDINELLEELRMNLRDSSRGSVTSRAGIVLGFPGQGTQFWGMAKELAEEYSGFRSILSKAATVAEASIDYSILDVLLGRTAEGQTAMRNIDDSEVAQVAIFIFQYTFSSWLKSLGITADAVIGYSIGEIAAAGTKYRH
jgi:acyl transferase domain-containing protein